MTQTELKIDGLQKLIKALKMKPPMARVGILGEQKRNESGLTNATVGAAHEFGTTQLPVRSFLRMPISEYLMKNLENSGAFKEEALKKVVQDKSLSPWVEKMAIEAVGIVSDAFDSGGNGAWIPSNMTHKKVKQTLVETQQLRNSITYDLKEGT